MVLSIVFGFSFISLPVADCYFVLNFIFSPDLRQSKEQVIPNGRNKRRIR